MLNQNVDGSYRFRADICRLQLQLRGDNTAIQMFGSDMRIPPVYGPLREIKEELLLKQNARFFSALHLVAIQ